MRRWIAVLTRASAQGRAHLGIEDAGFTVFCPFERTSYRIGLRKCVKITPVFPGYLFVECEPELLHRIREVDGVIDILRGYADPAAIVRLRMIRDMGGFDNTGSRWANEGQQVIANDPALGKLVAKIKKTPPHKRIKRLELDGDFPFRITAPIDKLQKIKA
jgi:transcription antitermination factor NusG